MVDDLTYYYARGTEPFRSLSALPDQEAIRIMDSHFAEGEVLWVRFRHPAQYLQEWRLAERWVRVELISLPIVDFTRRCYCVAMGPRQGVSPVLPSGVKMRQ